MTRRLISVLGIFAADLCFRTARMPGWGETVLGSGFSLGPGGKGSNQAVAVARLKGEVSFISKIGGDDFGRMALELYRATGVDTSHVSIAATLSTGAAAILVDDAAGENAIIVVPGAAATLSAADLDHCAPSLARSRIFLTQLELPLATVAAGLRLARQHGAWTMLNPAPAQTLDAEILALVDCMTPNESEAAALTGLTIDSLEAAGRAADQIMARGVGAVVVTLGAQGALVCEAGTKTHVPACAAGPVIDTTGAGDAFNAGLAVAVAEDMDLCAAARFACAVAGISVTRQGAATAMPERSEVDNLLLRSGTSGQNH